MSRGPCEGYACPPEHSVPSSTVIVVRTHEPDLANTGGTVDPTMPVLGLAAVIVGAVLITRARRAKNERGNHG